MQIVICDTSGVVNHAFYKKSSISSRFQRPCHSTLKCTYFFVQLINYGWWCPSSFQWFLLLGSVVLPSQASPPQPPTTWLLLFFFLCINPSQVVCINFLRKLAWPNSWFFFTEKKVNILPISRYILCMTNISSFIKNNHTKLLYYILVSMEIYQSGI